MPCGQKIWAVLCELCASSERQRTGGEKQSHHRDTEDTEKGERVFALRAKKYGQFSVNSVPQVSGSERVVKKQSHHRDTEGTEESNGKGCMPCGQKIWAVLCELRASNER